MFQLVLSTQSSSMALSTCKVEETFKHKYGIQLTNKIRNAFGPFQVRWYKFKHEFER